MTESFERRLAEELRAHPLPPEIPGLGARSVRRGRQIRRRRVVGVVGALVVLLTLPGAAGALLRRSSSETPPVTHVSVTPAAPVGPRSVLLDPAGRKLRGDPTVSTVRRGAVWSPSGRGPDLPDALVGTVTEHRGQPVWLTRLPDGRLELAGPGVSVPVGAPSAGVTGVEPGPAGSVMVRTAEGPWLWSGAAAGTRPPARELQHRDVHASAGALWTVVDGRVVRFAAADGVPATGGTALQPWRSVVLADPRADRVVVTEDERCQSVLDGTTTEAIWRTCDSDAIAFSPDGRYLVGQDRVSGQFRVIDLTTGELALAIDPEGNPVGPRMVFDEAARLNLRVGNDDVGWGLMICDLSADCWLTAVQNGGPLDLVLPNRS